MGVALDVVQPKPTPVVSDEPRILDRVLAVIPAESPALPVPVVPEVRAMMTPEPTIQTPPGRAGVLSEVVLTKADPLAVVLDEEGRAINIAPPIEKVAMQGPVKNGQPIALSEIKPQYPYGARVRGEAGRVTVQVRVSDQGVVESAEVLAGSGHPALDDSAIAATKTARFKPAEQDGKPVPSKMNLQFEFRLEDR